jgi:hypothetical protein
MPGLRYGSAAICQRYDTSVGKWCSSLINGKPEPKLFELLCYLRLWAGDVVGESVLTRCVSVLAAKRREP